MGESLAIAALIMFSINIVVTKLASATVDVSLGFFVAMVVNVLCATLIVIIQMLLRAGPLSLDVTALLLFALAGFFSTYLGRWLLYDSVVRLGPSRASAFQSSNPMFTVLLAWFLLDERLGGADLAASVAILFGLFLASHRPPELVPEKEDAGHAPGGSQHKVKKAGGELLGTIVSSGGLLALLGAFSYAVGNVLRGVAIESWNEPVLGVLVGALTGLVAYSALGSGARNIRQRLSQANRGGLRLFLFSGVLTVVAQACMVGAMRYIPVSIVTLITLSTPILVLPLGYFALRNNERLLPRTVIGSAIILGGITTIMLT